MGMMLQAPEVSEGLDHAALEREFNRLFADSYNTVLVGGADEPLYRPADSIAESNRILYTRDYAASALHEVAHWCVAGEQRRRLEDYGYWYAPDGRTQQQQTDFEQVEVKPQAMEWMFAVAAGRRFRVSADNLEAGLGATDGFKEAIYRQVIHYCEQGLPSRPRNFVEALAACSGVSDPLCPKHYKRESL